MFKCIICDEEHADIDLAYTCSCGNKICLYCAEDYDEDECPDCWEEYYDDEPEN